MAIAKSLAKGLAGASMIRTMFEEGERRKAEFGVENVYDFSLGNPVFEPPREVIAALIQILQSQTPGLHRYMPNAGLPETRAYVAHQLSTQSGLTFAPEDVVMCVGAGGALNVIFRSMIDPGSEVIVLAPYFVEYDYYIENFGGKPVVVPTQEDFTPDLRKIEQTINEKTVAVLINSPNNPTGVVYSQMQITALGQLLEKKSLQFGHPITLISDEPYREIVFDDLQVPSIFAAYAHSVVATSLSKELAIPGERIGYLAVSPDHAERKELVEAAVVALRTLGFVNAPALMQRMLPKVNGVKVDIRPYQTNRELLYNHLTSLGLNCVKPGGAFYLFPKCPIDDDVQFVKEAAKLNLLLVPGSAFRLKGYFRLAYCFETSLVKRSLPVFTELMNQYR